MKRLLCCILLSVVFASWGFAQMDLQTAAIVNLTRSEPITVGQLRTEVERVEKEPQQVQMIRAELTQKRGRDLTTAEFNQQLRQYVLDNMINERLAIQAAERDKITISENEVNQQLSQLRSQMVQAIGRQPTDAEFATAIRNETGMELPAFREQVRRQLLMQKFLMSKKQGTIESLKVPTETEISAAFNLARADFVRPETVRFSMIQVPYGSDAAAKTKAKELADRLIREIGGNPSKFDEVVLRGQAPNSGYMAGDGGYLPRNMDAARIVGQEFITTAFTIKQGEVSKIIEGALGYQIVKITETYTMKSLELDDIFQLGTRMTVRDYIGNTLLQRRQMEVLALATQELVTELRAGRTFQVFDRNLNW